MNHDEALARLTVVMHEARPAGHDNEPPACISLAEAALDDLWPLIEHLRSWAGLMEVLDEHYPAEVFDGSSGDEGPRIVALTRALNAARRAHELNPAGHDRMGEGLSCAMCAALGMAEPERRP